MGLTADQEALLPTDEDVDFYEEHGYYVSRKVLPDEVIDAAVRGAERHWSGERDWRLPISSGSGDWKPSDGDTIRNSSTPLSPESRDRSLVGSGSGRSPRG